MRFITGGAGPTERTGKARPTRLRGWTARSTVVAFSIGTIVAGGAAGAVVPGPLHDLLSGATGPTGSVVTSPDPTTLPPTGSSPGSTGTGTDGSPTTAPPQTTADGSCPVGATLVSLTAVSTGDGHGVLITATLSEAVGAPGMSALVSWSGGSAGADLPATSPTTYQGTATSADTIPAGATVRVGVCGNRPGGTTPVTPGSGSGSDPTPPVTTPDGPPSTTPDGPPSTSPPDGPPTTTGPAATCPAGATLVSLTALATGNGHGVLITAVLSEPVGEPGMSALVTWSTDSGSHSAGADLLANSPDSYQGTATSGDTIPAGATVRVGICGNHPGGTTTVEGAPSPTPTTTTLPTTTPPTTEPSGTCPPGATLVSLTAVSTGDGHGVLITAVLSEPVGEPGMSALVTWSTDSGSHSAGADLLANSPDSYQGTATSGDTIPAGATVRVGICGNHPGGSTTVSS